MTVLTSYGIDMIVQATKQQEKYISIVEETNLRNILAKLIFHEIYAPKDLGCKIAASRKVKLLFVFGNTCLPPYPYLFIRESLPRFENRIMARMYVRSIRRSTMYQKAPFC